MKRQLEDANKIQASQAYHTINDWQNTQGLPITLCSTAYISLEVNSKCLQFSLWLILNTLLATVAPRNDTFLAHAQGVVKMAWYGDERFQQRAVMEFFVTDRHEIKHGTNTLNRRQKQSMELHHPTCTRKKLKATSSAGKIMATAFWEAEEVILVDIMPRGQTIILDLYTQTLKTFRNNFKRARLHENNAEILLQHDSARPHTSFKK
jgi:hypothetical protein